MSSKKESTRKLNWKGYDLWDGGVKTKFSVVPTTSTYNQIQMFKVCWPDGIQSEDWYNLTHASENCVKAYRQYELEMAAETQRQA